MLLLVCTCSCGRHNPPPESHTFYNDTILPCTSVLSQGRTSTCWAFATASLLESDLMAARGDTIRLSVMYAVRQKYLNQFEAYYYSQGREEIRNGGLGHSFLRVVKEDGIVPWQAYPGRGEGVRTLDHSRLLKKLRYLAKEAVYNRDLNTYRKRAIALLDQEMGIVPDTFEYRGARYTPASFACALGLDTARYVQLASVAHHPFHEPFVLEVPDNWEHGTYYNVPLDELEGIVRTALRQGYTVAWHGDVSEKTFSAPYGLAVWPQGPVTQADRQYEIERFTTTDDHMMHIVGTAHDEQGASYYVVKNSYGRYGPYGGFIYMSADYFRAKTISVMLPARAVRQASVM